MSSQNKKKRIFHGRPDGQLVKNAPAMNILISLLYPKRCDCEVSAKFEMDVTELTEYIRKKNAENPEGNLKFFHCFITALVRVLCERKNLNRFIQGGRIYEHNDISVSFVAKRKFTDGATEALLTYRPKETDTVSEVSRFIIGEVKEKRKDDPKKNTAESTIDKLAALPFILRMIITKMARTLDYWGLWPKSMMEGDPAFSTVLVANLGSIGCPSAYHHLNNFGSCSIMMTIGTLTEKNIVEKDGTVSTRQVVDITATCDERIADGFYFSKSMKLLETILSTPELLEKPFEKNSGLAEAIK